MAIWFYLYLYETALGITIAAGSSTLYLSDAVLMTLLTTTTANVFGLFVIVAKYLFHTKD